MKRKKLSIERGLRNTENNLQPLLNGQRSTLNSILSNTSRGGVASNYYNTSVVRNPIQYAILNSKANIHGIALLRNLNNGETRYVNLIGTKQGLGAKLMSRIKRNAKFNGKHYIKLSSVPRAVGFYRKQGFRNNTTVTATGLVPMLFRFTKLLFRPKPLYKVKPLRKRRT